MNSGLFTSNSEEWETPQAVFDRQNKMFGFELDVCATPQNAKCTRFYTKEQDGLKQPWASRNWMNPPYGRNIGKWCARASAEGGAGNLTVALLPARTDTLWFHEYCAVWHYTFLVGRLKFKANGKEMQSAPFPSMLVFFGIPPR